MVDILVAVICTVWIDVHHYKRGYSGLFDYYLIEPNWHLWTYLKPQCVSNNHAYIYRILGHSVFVCMLVCALFSSQCATCLVNVCESSHLSMFLYMVCSLCPCSLVWLSMGVLHVDYAMAVRKVNPISASFSTGLRNHNYFHLSLWSDRICWKRPYSACSQLIWPPAGSFDWVPSLWGEKSHRAKRVAFLQDEGAQPLNLSSKPKASESKSPTSPASPQVPTLKLGPGSLKHSAHSSIGGPPSRLSSIGTHTSTVHCNSINT